MSNAIGGYFGLECANNAPYHRDVVALNSARNALRYVIRAYGITEIYAPYYTCPVVWDAIMAENVQIVPYDIDANFMPDCDIPHSAFILYNNYFGINTHNVELMARRYPNLIIDNAQAFYQPRCGMASFYSPRKFFGLPDGGLVICDKHLPDNFDPSVSFDMCSHLLKRIDIGAEFGYGDFQQNDNALTDQPIKQMSKLTATIMGNINYELVKQQRISNFTFLHNALRNTNEMDVNLSFNDVPMVYPFKTSDSELRVKLIENKIFVAKYWPVTDRSKCMTSIAAQNFANTIVSLPIDQRYNETEMQRILGVINANIN